MSTLPPNHRPPPIADPRIDELLADRALTGLEPIEQAELMRLSGVDAIEVTPTDLAAARAALAFLDSADAAPMPEAVRQRLLRTGEAWCRSVRAEQPGAAPLPFRPASTNASRWRVLPWLVAAASVALAVYAFLPAGAPAPLAGRRSLLASGGDVLTLAWSDWDNPEIAGVKGDVVWSESQQQGFLRFQNLTPVDPTVEQYQLWIIDSRGMNQRVSGGIFDGAQGEVVIPIQPGIQVQGAAAFAVTIERPGGTWVSDMTRRVVIAAK